MLYFYAVGAKVATWTDPGVHAWKDYRMFAASALQIRKGTTAYETFAYYPVAPNLRGGLTYVVEYPGQWAGHQSVILLEIIYIHG